MQARTWYVRCSTTRRLANNREEKLKMECYENLVMETIEFENEDVIMTSPAGGPEIED